MTEAEIIKLVFVVKATYSRFFKDAKEAEIDEMISSWKFVLEDYPYEQGSAALKIYLASDSKGFPPSPGQIVDCIQRLKPKADYNMTGLEAWSLVRKAIYRGIYHAEEEYAKLPELVQRAIGSAANIKELAQMDINQVETVEQSHFIRAFEALSKAAKEEEKIPQIIRNQIAQQDLVGRLEVNG